MTASEAVATKRTDGPIAVTANATFESPCDDGLADLDRLRATLRHALIEPAHPPAP